MDITYKTSITIIILCAEIYFSSQDNVTSKKQMKLCIYSKVLSSLGHYKKYIFVIVKTNICASRHVSPNIANSQFLPRQNLAAVEYDSAPHCAS